MFNLFRRAKNKTKSKNSAKPEQKNNQLATLHAEKYRSLSEDESERVIRVRANARATIEELDDLHDLEEQQQQQQPADDEEEEQKRGAYKRNNQKHKNGDNFYFDDEVNIAKAAPNFTANEAAKRANAARETEAKCARGKPWAATANSATSGLSNIATALEFSKINKIVAATWDDDAHSRSQSSRNELAERQGHNLSGGNKNYNSTNINNRILKHNQPADAWIPSKTPAINDAKENVEPATTNTTKTTTARTTNVTEAATAPSLNEVKYRNPSKSQKNATCKRQSWLGLTLVHAKHRNQVDESEETPKKKAESSSRKSFFLSKSKSIDNEKLLTEVIDKSQQVNRPNSSLFFNEAETVLATASRENGVERKKLRPLEKSRDFLSEILMARGRNNNRNRNQQQQQQQQQHRNNNVVKSAQSKSDTPLEPSKIVPISNVNPINVNDYVSANAGDSSLHRTHLETTYDDPASAVSTNSYQITMSNNSHKNVNRRSCSPLSNSAESSHQQADPALDEQRQLNATQCAEAGDALGETNSNEQDERLQLNCLTSEQRRNAFPTNLQQPQPSDSANLSEDAQPRTTSTGIDSSDRDRISTRSSANETGAKSQLNELTECDRDRWLHCAKQDVATSVMGQTNVKPETPRSSRASTPREFRESVIDKQSKPKIALPTITVVDYSDDSSGDGSPVEQKVFYDFENGPRAKGVKNSATEGICISAVEEDEFHESSCNTSAEDNKWQFISSHSLADVPEQEEEQSDEEVDEEEEQQEDEEKEKHNAEVDKLDHAGQPFKSNNTSDSNLSNSFPDSGIGDSFTSHSGSPTRVLLLDSCDLLNERNADLPKSTILPKSTSLAHATKTSATSISSHMQHLPFIRDGNSTDCEESLMQCDDFDFDFVADSVSDLANADYGANERLVCIESISLPDVVVESTVSSANNNSHSSNSLTSNASSSGSEHIININGATGNSMGNVHFIPIHVEGSGGGGAGAGAGADSGMGQKRRSLDDSVIGSGGKKSYGHLNGNHLSATIEITAEEDEEQQMKQGLSNGVNENSTAEKLKRELVTQESRYNEQLEDAQKNASNLQNKVNEMQTRIETLEKDLSLKTWNVERLQGELGAAQKDDEYVRRKLKLLEDEKTNLRHKYCDNEEELKNSYEELEKKYKELEEKYKQAQELARSLHTQLSAAQSEAEACRQEVEQLREELEEQLRILKNALDNSEAERKISENKWQREFEMLRTHNQDREESLMTDCEWQLRHMQKTCKDKIDKAESGRREALVRAETLECAAQERLNEMQRLRNVEVETKTLHGLVNEQEHSLRTLTEQLESLKADLQAANDSLEEQIEAVRMIKYQCDNKIYDKERELIQRIDHVRNEAAYFWENKLYTEMTRLKSELESVYVDERREALDKLQAEHIEELRALTTRYTANEEELRTELAELQEKFEQKSSEFMDLRAKSDSALLQTRMHLDRADREYQRAMSREEERREALEESLRKEFETEKLDMEEKFRERLGHVKEEFAKELQLSTQDMVEEHKKQLEKQKAKLHAERDEALQEIADRHRKKLAVAEDKIKDIELRHQRDLKDLQETYVEEKTSLDKRDISNANEIEQLHRKCRCLTNLFEEMRMRYERRDPRQEDLREIAELRSRCESQERDLYLLTDRLREMQIQMEELQQNGDSSHSRGAKAIKKPPPKTIPTNCDVIYEENEERDSPPPATATKAVKETVTHKSDAEEDDEEEDDDEEEEEEEEEEDDEEEEEEEEEKVKAEETTTAARHANKQEYIKNTINNKKCNDLVNEDDGHMITAV